MNSPHKNSYKHPFSLTFPTTFRLLNQNFLQKLKYFFQFKINIIDQ
ncbi:hypothetical protein YPPY34_1640 [Yersinia pestis PY-34]|nr:hypothetical protein YPPY04_1649 [Yersinia pestis PY-04]EIR36092.1 hypothetical protein YPPY11_1748 [Yersinia pestis PY-11]EIR79294.1 hypothetical protein YPPY34_1640 [Yersinia pestis PY-34]EIS20879.1 hypothetical protein YPPY53_1686 [Yersinia pestis PY-53]EIS34183.1 hypothetical protein YPPY56_1702 [Yersinia pestis PY-56]EIS98475.1 hypothetical protein YPPY89_1815 [Yersinia pestis PY-89]